MTHNINNGRREDSMITNVHIRDINASLSAAGTILNSLASENDLLWPYEKWPAMVLDKPLGVGASGGHGTAGYIVEAYEPGKYIRFRFTAQNGFIGTHCFSLTEMNAHTVQFKHEIKMRLEGSAKFAWPLMVRWLHDALIEDAFDKVESFITSSTKNRTWSLWVRFLRALLGRQIAAKKQ